MRTNRWFFFQNDDRSRRVRSNDCAGGRETDNATTHNDDVSAIHQGETLVTTRRSVSIFCEGRPMYVEIRRRALTLRGAKLHAPTMPEFGRQLFGRCLVLGALGLVAVGVSGLVAAAAGRAFGESWVAGDPPTVHYSAADCADYMEYAPRARSCEQAATVHHFSEVVDYRVAAGLVGALVFGACAVGSRRRERWFRIDRLPPAFDATVAAVLFGAAGVWLSGYGIDQQVLGYRGAGLYLSGAVVALVGAALASIRFARISLRAE
jgi:hypothetical protein